MYPPTTPIAPQGIQRLLDAYPEHLIGYEDQNLIWCDGRRMPYDQEKEFVDFNDMLNRADLRAQMAQVYPSTMDTLGPPPYADPGRIRDEAFFRQMYGQHQEEVEAYLEPVQWLPSTTEHTVMMTSINQVHQHLHAVSMALDSLPDSLKQFVLPPIGGGYSWRPIAGTARMSMHSFGICIDIAVRHSDYWRWREPVDRFMLSYYNRIPHEIVNIFEQHGFIWGGKWYHYDTMHFEYRPELL